MRRLIWLLIFFSVFSFTVSANQLDDFKKNSLENSGANNIIGSLPTETQKDMAENGITSSDVSGFSMGGFFSMLFSKFKAALAAPLKMLASLCGVMLLASLLGSCKTAINESSCSKVFQVVTLLCVSAIVVIPVVNMVKEAVTVMKNASDFMLCFIPTFGSIVTMSGKPVTGAMFSGVLLTAVQIIAGIISRTLLPLLCIFIALSLMGAVNDSINISGVTSAVKNIVLWTIGLLLTVFIALLSVQTIVSASADNVASKTTKFLISSTIPVVGGALSEAYNSVAGCLVLMKSTVGSLGIIACIMLFLPTLISALVLIGALSGAGCVGEILNTEKIPQLIKSLKSVLVLIVGLILCYGVMFILSVTIVLSAGLGV